jgi:hypothetical protein
VAVGRQNAVRRSPFIVPSRPLAGMGGPLNDLPLETPSERVQVIAPTVNPSLGGLDGSRKHRGA